MKNVLKLIGALLIVAYVSSCGKKMTFEEQITNDVITKMGTGICDSIPAGAEITNVIIGEITPIVDTGLIDVELEFDYI